MASKKVTYEEVMDQIKRMKRKCTPDSIQLETFIETSKTLELVIKFINQSLEKPKK